jgi:hypothetical protein
LPLFTENPRRGVPGTSRGFREKKEGQGVEAPAQGRVLNCYGYNVSTFSRVIVRPSLLLLLVVVARLFNALSTVEALADVCL